MARKKKKRKQHKKTTKTLSLQQRAIQAKNALDYGHYQKAIVHLKPLLKADPKEEWKEWAYTAHIQLALQLLQQNKDQDVITLYESGHRLCSLSLSDAVYIRALLRKKQYKKVLGFYEEIENNMDKAELFSLRSELAAVALAGEKQLIEQLPDDDPVVTDYENAFQLLTDYCDANDEAVSTGLKTLSFRSPYRDLRQIIAAAVQLDVDAEKSRELLSKVSETSAFIAIATPIKLIAEGTESIISSFSSLPDVSQQLISEIKGWSDGRTGKKGNKNGIDKFLKELMSLTADPDFPMLFRIADSFKSVHPAFFRDCAKIATIHGVCNHHRAITPKRFAQRFSSPGLFELTHLEALTAGLELEAGKAARSFDPHGHLYDLEELWLDYLNLLNKKHKDRPIITALVCRYIVSVWDKYSRELTDNNAKLLEKSLQSDPEDKDTHLRLIRHYLDIKKLKQARDGMTLALKHYPENLPLLLLAIEVAIAGNAYKKAANYAKTILDVDPINRQAKTLLCNAHLSHARKLIKTNKWHLVDKELQAAEQWANNESVMLSVIAIHKAVMAQTNKQKSLAKQEMQKLNTLMPNSLSASFILRLESQAINADVQALHKLAGLKWIPLKKQSKDVLFLLMDFCNASDKTYEAEAISEVLNDLSPSLSTIVKKDISSEEYVQILEFWHQRQQEFLLSAFVEQAIKKYGKTPILTYYRYINDYSLSNADYDAIDNAIDLAKEQGDSVTVGRLIALLNNAPSFSPFGSFLDDEFDEDDFDYGHAPESLPSIPPFMVDQLEHADIDTFLSLITSVLGLPKKELSMMREAVGDDEVRKLFLSLLSGSTSLEDSIRGFEPEPGEVIVIKPKPKKTKPATSKKPSKKTTQSQKKAESNPRQIDIFGGDFE